MQNALMSAIPVAHTVSSAAYCRVFPAVSSRRRLAVRHRTLFPALKIHSLCLKRPLSGPATVNYRLAFFSATLGLFAILHTGDR
eukprot:IDg13042t1